MTGRNQSGNAGQYVHSRQAPDPKGSSFNSARVSRHCGQWRSRIATNRSLWLGSSRWAISCTTAPSSVRPALTMNSARQPRTALGQRYRPPSPWYPSPGRHDGLGDGRRCHRSIRAGRPNADSRGAHSRIAASSCSSDNSPAVIDAT